MSRIKVLKKNPADEIVWQYEGTVLRRKENQITLYSDRWYNIFEIYDRDNGKFKGWYCNIGKPAVIADESVSYVDLALDLWVSAAGRQTVLDEDELEALGLPDNLKQKAYAGLKDLQKYMESKNPPT